MAKEKEFKGFSRRSLLKVAGVGALITAGWSHVLIAKSSARKADGNKTEPASASSITADQALQRLQAGNQRYVNKKQIHPDQTEQRLLEVAKGQHPFAIILGCADSRVPPEIIFDQGLGNLFVVRVAGNIVDDAIVGSIEYAVEELGVPLLVVLGHERCGAVAATLKGGNPPGNIGTLVRAIQPAVDSVRNQPGDPLDNAVRANTKLVVEQLRFSQPIVAELVKANKLKVVGCRYDLDSGKVDLIA